MEKGLSDIFRRGKGGRRELGTRQSLYVGESAMNDLAVHRSQEDATFREGPERGESQLSRGTGIVRRE